MTDFSDKLEIVNLSDVGRRRPHNEDSTLTDAKQGFVVLADGMGGYKAGEVASAIAVTSIYHEIKEGLKHFKRARNGRDHAVSRQGIILKNAIIQANSNIYNTAQNDAQCHGMGTTVVAMLFHDGKFSVAHVGDSRLYRKRAKEFKQITQDHSLIQELINRGMYTPEEAAKNTPKNLVTRALGIDEHVEVDLMEETALPNDLYLLCSDGLNDMVDDEEIHLTLSKYSANLVQAAQELIRQANANGGKDNTSVILIRIREGFSDPRGPVGDFLGRFF